MAAVRHIVTPPALLLLLLGWSLTCQALPLQEDPEDVTTDPTVTTSIPTYPPVTESNVIDLQEQIYIITGVFITFIILLLVVSMGTAYVVIGLQQTIKSLQSIKAPAAKTNPAQKRQSRRPAPKQPRNNKTFAPDDDDEDEDDDIRWGGDEIQDRGFDQFSGNERNEPPRAGRQFSSPSEPQGYDRFHQPLPDAHMPSDRARRDSHSRYGAGNLARLPKGPAPQPGGYDGRYPDDRDRRARSPQGRGQW